MTMECGLDLHRRQITFDALEVESGEVWTGKVWQHPPSHHRVVTRSQLPQPACPPAPCWTAFEH